MSKNNRYQSKTVYKTGKSPEPNQYFDWDNMEQKEVPKFINKGAIPSFNALVTAFIFLLLIIFLIYRF